jgi:hypothetical protein
MSAAPPAFDADLVAGLRRLKLAKVRRMAPEVLHTAKVQRWSPEEVLRTLVEAEIAARDESNHRTRLRTAGFPVHKTLEEFKVAQSSVPQATFDYVASLEWIRAAENLCLIGPAGTGKSHLLVGAGHAAVAAGCRVRYFAAADLVETLYRGLADNSVGKLIDGLLRSDLISSTRSGLLHEYLFYQTLVAAHPIDAERAWAYMLKAVREAKEETSWLEPDAAYEAALERFVRQMVADPEVAGEIGTLVEAMTPRWQELSLSQTLIKLTAPGVPDIYQGSELWHLRLVDPDNRTPVDYDLRRRLLRDVSEGLHDRLMARLDESLPKLRLIVITLAVRARNDDAFANGSGYQPLPVQGSRSEHAVCFSRRRPDGESATATIAFRRPLLLDRTWDDTTVLLPAGPWRNALTGADVDGGKQRLDALLADAPVALLERA